MDTTQLYKQIVKDIKDRIMTGHLKPGEKIPSETELLDIYNTSKTTISKSLNILANEGYISTVPRVGNYVSKPKEDRYNLHYLEIESLNHIWDDVKIRHLQISQDDKVHKQITLSKIFYAHDKAICYNHKSMFIEPSTEIDEKKMFTATLSDLLPLACDIININKIISLEAAFCPKTIAPILDLTEDQVILIIHSKYYDINKNLIGEEMSYFHKDYISVIATS